MNFSEQTNQVYKNAYNFIFDSMNVGQTITFISDLDMKDKTTLINAFLPTASYYVDKNLFTEFYIVSVTKNEDGIAFNGTGKGNYFGKTHIFEMAHIDEGNLSDIADLIADYLN